MTPDATDDLWALSTVYRQRSAVTLNHALREPCRLRDPRVAGYVAAQLAAHEPDWFELDWDVLPLLGPWAAEHCGTALLDHVATAADGTLRVGAIEALGRATTPTDPAAPEVVDAVRRRIGSTAILRAWGGLGTAPDRVARVLGDFGPAAVAALPDLRAMLDHPRRARPPGRRARRVPDRRRHRARTRRAGRRRRGRPLAVLAAIGPAGVGYARVLRDRLARRDPVVAARAAVAYWRVTGDAEPVVPVLVRSLGDAALGMRPAGEPIVSDDPFPQPVGDAAARTAAVRCLAEIGPAAASALPLLRTAVAADRRQVRGAGLADTVAADDEWRRYCADAAARVGATA